MAKSKQINFSLQSDYQASLKQQNVIDQTDFIENPQNTRVFGNNDFQTFNMSLFELNVVNVNSYINIR